MRSWWLNVEAVIIIIIINLLYNYIFIYLVCLQILLPVWYAAKETGWEQEPHRKPPSQPPNHFHLLLQISGTRCQIICHPFQLFLLLEELTNITYSCLLTQTVMQNLVRSNQLNVSRFVIHRQLLPSLSPEIPCHPSKGVPSERLRLVKWFISHMLHTGACVNLVLLTYLLTILFLGVTTSYMSLGPKPWGEKNLLASLPTK